LIEIPPMKPMKEFSALIIDEDPVIHQLLHNCLMDIGVGLVNTAQNAFYAVRRCEEIKFDIIFVSFNVKSDKDGFHLLEELKFKGHITKSTTVIFLSAETDPSLVHCVVEMQPSDFWVKPLVPKRVEQRLKHIFAVKEKLHKLHYCVDVEEFSSAVYLSEQFVKKPDLKHYFPNIKRLKGDCLFQLFEYEEAELYYKALLKEYNFGWVHVGLIKAMLAQQKLEEVEPLVEKLKEREDTRFLMYDTMARYYIEHENYQLAYEEIKTATQLAPRNIDRNKKSSDLARLNHDRMGQFMAAQNVAKYARNSVHDSPELRLNVIRSGIDLATTLGENEARTILRKTERIYKELEDEFGAKIQDQLNICKVRMMTLAQDKDGAEKLLKERVSKEPGASIEDNLDKVKAFHELGHREDSLRILESVKEQIGGDTWSSKVVNEYIEQEQIERKEIHFTAKELGEMAKTHFKEKRLKPAYTNLTQAFKLSPNNPQLSMSLLRVMTALVEKEKEALDEFQKDLATECVAILAASSLDEENAKKLESYSHILGIDMSNMQGSSAAES
jgi:CheY-like chemotaxis protein